MFVFNSAHVNAASKSNTALSYIPGCSSYGHLDLSFLFTSEIQSQIIIAQVVAFNLIYMRASFYF